MGKNSGNCIIAITGPSASGKSMLAKRLSELLGKNRCLVLCQDDYYKDWSYLTRQERKKINFDDAKAFDFALLEKHIAYLKKGNDIEVPQYSFKQSKRLSIRYTLNARRYVIVEGLMPFLKNELRRLFDFKIYVDIDNAESLSRRLKRDIDERGETAESVRSRYFNHVLPMQKRYVEKQKRWADVVVDGRHVISGEMIRKMVKKIEDRG